MKLLRLLITVVLMAALFNTGYAQEPATPYGTPSGASKFDGKLYVNGLLYPPVFADTPQVGTLYYPKRLGALIIKRISADSGLVYIFMGNKWVELLSSNPGGAVDLSGYYDKTRVDSIADRLRAEFPIVMNPDWNASTGPSAILNKPSIPEQFVLTSADGTITLVGTGSQLAISVTPNYFIPLSQKAISDGVATLDGTGKIPINQLPALTLNQPKGVQTIAQMLSSSAVVNDVYIVADSNKSYILANAPPSDFNNWLVIQAPIPTNTDLLPEGSVNFYFSSAKAIAALTGQNISLFNNNLNFISRVELSDSTSNMVHKTGNETLGTGIKTFTDSVRVITPSKTDSSKNAANTDWVKSQNYLASLGKLPPGAIPYANAQGILTYDGTGLYWDGSSLNAGHSGFYNWVGLGLNGGRARLVASGFGAQFSTSGGYPMDASKSISFYNSITRYGVFSMRSSSDSTLRFLSDMEIVPSATSKLNLGSLSNQWNNTYTKNLYINGVLFVPGSGTGGGAVTSYNNRIGDIVPQSTDYSSFYKPLSYVPDWSEITNKQFIPTNNNQLPNGAGYTTVPITSTLYQPIENQRLSKTDSVKFRHIVISDGQDSALMEAGSISVTSLGGLSAINNDGYGGILTLQNKNGSTSKINTKWLHSSQAFSLPNAANGSSGNTIPIGIKLNNVNYLSDSAGIVDLGNNYATGTGTVSGTNTGDQDLSGLVPKTTTVAGKPLSGNITLVKGDVGLGNVDNTADVSKPVSTAQQAALNLKANDNAVMHLTGNETSTGVKTFASGFAISPTGGAYMLLGGAMSFNSFSSGGGGVGNNLYQNGGWKYRNDGAGSVAWGDGTGAFVIYTAPPGLAGAAATISQKFSVSNTGLVELTNVPNGVGDFLTISGSNITNRRTAAQTLSDIGAEPTITTKNTAFNKNFGTTAGTVKEGNYIPTNLDASVITSGRLDTSHSPITNLYATDGIKGTKNSSGITFRADSTVWRLGGNNDLLHNDTSHRIGLEKNDTLLFRVNGNYAGVISENGGNLSFGIDGMAQYYIDPTYTGEDNVNFATTGQYYNLTGNRNTSGGNLSLTRILVSDNTAWGYHSLYSNKYGGKTVGIGVNAGASYSFNFENLQECTFLGTEAAPVDTWPTSTQMVRSMALGMGAKVTKSYQTVIGSPDTQETLIRGSVYANMVPRDSGVNTIDTIRLNVDAIDGYWANSLANDVFIANPTGFLKNFKEVIYRIGANGAPHNLSFGTMFRFADTVPTSVAANATLYIRGYYNSSNNTIDVIETKTFNPAS